MLRDSAIFGDSNVIRRVVEKVLKCKDLIIEILRLWIRKERVIPLMIGTTRNISNH